MLLLEGERAHCRHNGWAAHSNTSPSPPLSPFYELNRMMNCRWNGRGRANPCTHFIVVVHQQVESEGGETPRVECSAIYLRVHVNLCTWSSKSRGSLWGSGSSAHHTEAVIGSWWSLQWAWEHAFWGKCNMIKICKWEHMDKWSSPTLKQHNWTDYVSSCASVQTIYPPRLVHCSTTKGCRARSWHGGAAWRLKLRLMIWSIRSSDRQIRKKYLISGKLDRDTRLWRRQVRDWVNSRGGTDIKATNRDYLQSKHLWLASWYCNFGWAQLCSISPNWIG